MSAVAMKGMVRADGTLELEGKVDLPPGAVSVTLEPVPYSQETDPFFVMLRGIWAEREKAGLPTRTREEIDAEIRQFRDEADERIEELGRLQDEGRRRREDARKQEDAAP